MAERRCPIHDVVHEESKKCPLWTKDSDCEVHRVKPDEPVAAQTSVKTQTARG
jgi:hypothetical protein